MVGGANLGEFAQDMDVPTKIRKVWEAPLTCFRLRPGEMCVLDVEALPNDGKGNRAQYTTDEMRSDAPPRALVRHVMVTASFPSA